MSVVYATDKIRSGDWLTLVWGNNGTLYAHPTDLEHETVHAIALEDAAIHKEVQVGALTDTGGITTFDAEEFRRTQR